MNKQNLPPNTPENQAMNRRILLGFAVLAGGLLAVMLYGALT